MSIRTAFFTTSLLLGTAIAAPAAMAQAISTPSNDQPQTSTSAIQKAQNSTFSRPNNALPTNPRTIAEQPDQPAPAAPAPMTLSPNETGPVPSNQKDVHKLHGKHHHTHQKSSAPSKTSSPE